MASGFPFDYFCNRLQSIRALKIEAKKKERVGEMIKNWREKVGNDLFPLMRLLLPNLDRERASYGLKEQKFADLYIKIMGMDKNSDDAKSLIQFKKPPAGKVWFNDHIDQGHFIVRLAELLRLRMLSQTPPTTISIAQVNEKLDELASSSTTDEKESIIRYFYTNCTLPEQIWIARIILKNLDFGMTERSLLPICHPDALEYYNVNTNLKAVFKELQDPMKRKNNNQLQLLCPFKPMLSENCQPSEVAVLYPEGFWIETKIDGERMQMHMKTELIDGMEIVEYRWWSRNSFDYTSMYGSNRDNGSLVPFISKSFKKGVSSCILDGEMVAYNTDTKSFEPFGSLKTAANDVNNATDSSSSSSKCHPCFVVFDLLFLNGKSLLERPLRKRFEYLEKMIVSNDLASTRIQVQEHQIGKTEEDIFAALELRIANNEEGLVIKNPESLYSPNAKGKNWIKIKPDNIRGMSEDMDLVMVGAYYGKGSRGGSFGSFLCAVLDDSDNAARYISFCKFGTGVKKENYLEVSLEKQGNWVKFDPQKKPDWLVLPVKSDWPDMIIEPSKSHVVQVRANELIPSKTFPAGITARFPRFIRLRTTEKGIEEALTKSQLHDYNLLLKGKRQMETEGIQKGEKRLKSSSKSCSIVAGFVGLNSEDIAKKSTIFEGLEFCVMVKTASDSGELKRETERMIIELGGSLTQVPSLHLTKMIIADEFTIRVRNQQGLLDIVKSKYISDCANALKAISLSPKYMLAATLATESTFTSLVDKYHDSFRDDVDVADLKVLFSNMPISSVLSYPVFEKGPVLDEHIELKQRMASLSSRYMKEPFCGHLFAGSVFYITPSDLEDLAVSDDLYFLLPQLQGVSRESQCHKGNNLDPRRCMLISDIRLGGGVVVEALNLKTSYAVCNKVNQPSISNLFAKYPTGTPISRIVSEDWIAACVHAETLISEFF